MNTDKTAAGQPATTRRSQTLRTGNTQREIRNAIDEIRSTLDYPRSQMPGETFTHFITRQRRASVTAAKALGRDTFVARAESILLGRVSK